MIAKNGEIDLRPNSNNLKIGGIKTIAPAGIDCKTGIVDLTDGCVEI